MNGLSFADVIGLFVVWAGAVGVVVSVAMLNDVGEDIIWVAIGALIVAYYLSKWIILKKES